MCVSPTIVYRETGPYFVRQEIPCRFCWACLKNKQNDLIGKALMEAASCDWSMVVTLTYDNKKLPNDDLSATLINKKHFQDLMKRLRKSHSIRYLVAGEYGKRKRRAHFHAVFFGVGLQPEIPPLRTREHWEPWPYGFSYFDVCDAKSIEYIAKYLTKAKKPKTDQEHEEEWVSYSKKPPLGIRFVLEHADRHVAEKIVPRSFRINPPGMASLNRKVTISGTSQLIFLDRFYSQWPEALNMKKTEWMENATTRYIKWKHQKAWESLSPGEQQEALSSLVRLPWPKKELTEADYLWHDFKQTEDYYVDLETVERWLEKNHGLPPPPR